MRRASLEAIASGLVLLAAAQRAWAGAYDTRDWAKHPVIVEREQPATLWAIGDIHGDYERLIGLLAAARIIPSAPASPDRAAWSAGDAALVINGDMIDKGPRPMDVLRFLRSLQAAARMQRGEVIVLTGNHEAELLAPPAGKQTADRIADWGRLGVPAGDLRACMGDIGEFLCTLPFGARVGDWFFSHAGNTGGRTIRQLSTEIQDGAYKLAAPDSILEARLGEGKEWFADSKTGERQLLASYAAALGVKHMVQGHQHNNVKFDDGVERHTGEMFQRWGLLFLTDVGMSREVGDSHGAALKITSAGAVAVCPDGMETPLWDPSSDASSGRAAPCAH